LFPLFSIPVASPPETKPLKPDTDDLRSTVAAIDDCEASGSSDTATAHQQAQDQTNQTKNGVSGEFPTNHIVIDTLTSPVSIS
jgi:hypothetical protein